MASTDSDATRYKCMITEITSHQLHSPKKKTRSNSLNRDLEQDDKEIKEETFEKKIDVKQLRQRFEKNDKPADPPAPPPRSAKTRQSLQINSIASKENLATKLTTTTYRGTSLTQLKLPSSTSNETEQATRKVVDSPKVSIKPKMNLSNDEQEEPPSPLPPSLLATIEERSTINTTENNDSEQPKSVQSLRELFTKQLLPMAQPPIQRPQAQNIARLSAAISIPIIRPVTSNLSSSPPEKFIKSQLCDSQSLPSLDKLEPTTGDSSISSNHNLSVSNSSDVSFTDEENETNVEKRAKLRKCFEEVYTTEKSYTKVLYVLSYKLSEEVKSVCEKDESVLTIFNDAYKQLVGNFKQIYQLHHDILLPEFEKYTTGQLTGSMWSVLEQNFKPIEVLYKNYYIIYSSTQGKIDELCKNYPLINEAMLKCQAHLGNIYPTAQFNCSNQRLLRYILLMDTCMKYLEKNSNEYKHTRSIHDELDRIAIRCEEALTISSNQLFELRDRLENKFECIKGGRNLLWHGPVKKQSPRRYLDITQRYLILFSDCILVCNEESGRKLEIKRELSMRGITIDFEAGPRTSMITNADQSSPSTVYYPFRVNAVEKSYEFLAEKESDRQIWVKKIQQASDDYNKRNTGIEIRRSSAHRDEQQLGVRAPAWVNDNDVTRCQNCNNRFKNSIISSRRHHCRSCGRCICNSCSTRKIILEYCKAENEVRVCDGCYTHFTGVGLTKNIGTMIKPTRDIERTILYGDFRMIAANEINWIALQEDFQLHVFGGKLDQAENFAIKLSDLIDIQLDNETRTFTLRETMRTHVFVLESNHQIFYDKNDFLEDKLKTSESKLSFYANLWFESMQLARSTTLPDWYIRKRDSADSGVSNIG